MVMDVLACIMVFCSGGKVGEKEEAGTALYEQFLQGELSATMAEGYSPVHSSVCCSTYGLGERKTYTLEEMEREVADDYLHPKWPGADYDPEATCDGIRYAYVDSMDGGEKILLLRFDFDERDMCTLYTYDTPAYTVVALAAEDGRLSVIAQYDVTEIRKVTAYENGLLYACASTDTDWHTESFAGVLLPDRGCERIYGQDILVGEGLNIWKWESDLGYDIYEDVLATERELLDDKVFRVKITTVYGNGSAHEYYQYHMNECTEQEEKICRLFLNRCREEASIVWTTEAEVQSAVTDRCKELGFDYEETVEPVEVEWAALRQTAQ